MNKEMEELVNKLNNATFFYNSGNPIMKDWEWDQLFCQLRAMEEEIGEVLPNSPTNSIPFEFVKELKKVKHDHLMLSLDKTKNLDEIISFIGDNPWIAMLKMDGLTCSLTYEDGALIKAETRGDGMMGEDILHNAKIIKNIPRHINTTKKVYVIDGEIICRYKDFEPFKEVYKNPRNFASGSIRLLNSKECNARNLSFVAWDVINGSDKTTLTNKLKEAREYGFTIVPFVSADDIKISQGILQYLKGQAKIHSYPTDGTVFKLDDVEEFESKGKTDHHFKGGIALKDYDELYDTKLKYIEWTMGRTGVLTPVAIFEPINIDGSTIERASLHNVSVMKEVLGDCAYVGEPLKIYRANMIIPQIAEAGPKYDYGYVIANGGVSAHDTIENCPLCGHPVSYKKSKDGITNVYCDNSQCSGKLVNVLGHFCSKKGLDIKGISKATLTKLIDWEWVNSILDLYSLEKDYKKDFIAKPGFGEKSVTKILDAIENSKHTTLNKFIAAMGIPLIGQTASNDLADAFSTYQDFRNAVMDDEYHFFKLPNFGEEMDYSLKTFDYDEMDELAKLFTFEKTIVEKVETTNTLAGKVFVITGKLKTYKNRAALEKVIKDNGGKVSSTVNAKTSYLINNDITSTTSKNLNAKKLNIPIITEDEFKSMLG